MRILIFGCACILFLASCISSKKCIEGKDLIGNYKSISEPDLHSVEIKSDGRFIHTYKDTDTTLINNGVWSFNQKKCSIMLSNWKSYGKYKENDCLKGCSYTVDVKQETLVFNFDLEEMNFKKE